MADLDVAKGGTGADDGGWTYRGETAGPAEVVRAREALDTAAGFLRITGPPTATFTIDDPLAVALLYRAIHDISRRDNPRGHRRCHTCHPEMAPRPLAVDGHKYRRRQLARQKRKRR